VRPVPIGDHGLIGDTRSAALVSPAGSIDWWCVPRFDSAPVFARLLGGDDAGHFSLAPSERATVARRAYADSTTSLVTTWNVDGAELTVVDSMIGDVTGRLLPANLLVRRVSATGRPVSVTFHLSTRFGYRREGASRVRPWRGGLLIEHGGLAIAVMSDSGAALAVDDDITFSVTPGRPVTVSLSVNRDGPAVLVPPDVAAREAERDERGWRSWADTVEISPRLRGPVTRSLLTLQLLTYSPSGAPVAAPTTSLPEDLGGTRNWDYRYAWPRDASIGIAAFLGVGKPREARSFLAWLRHASRLARPRLPALFTIDGRPGPGERELAWPGYAGSRPVRVGNGASDQHQLDGYGWVLDAAWLLVASGERLDGETWRIMRGFADHVMATWTLPDAGIWERRDEPRHHTHSKLMAWLALDRAARIADRRGGRAAVKAAAWRASRDAIGVDVRSRAYDVDVGAYPACYVSTELDAAVRVLPLGGVDPAASPRVAATVDAIRARLGAGGPLLYRYVQDDGLPGSEGAFLPCSFWLVQALARLGRVDEAEALFGELVTLGGPLGLYGEEMDPATHAHLGNYPQALTHAALLQAALALDDRARGPSPAPRGYET
jgi:GH15 family glucan-1,4-alpha-glucosidase